MAEFSATNNKSAILKISFYFFSFLICLKMFSESMYVPASPRLKILLFSQTSRKTMQI